MNWVTALAIAVCVTPANACGGQDEPVASFPDVSNHHWAADAVRSLKNDGILVGYPPGKAPTFPAPRPFDRKFIVDSLKRWKNEGLLVGYPDGYHTPPPEERTRYDFAVAIYAGIVKMQQAFDTGNFTDDILRETIAAATAVQMCEPELDSLGVDPKKVIRQLKEMAAGYVGRQFRG